MNYNLVGLFYVLLIICVWKIYSQTIIVFADIIFGSDRNKLCFQMINKKKKKNCIL